VSKAKKPKKKTKLVHGDDAIESSEADWFDFETPARELAKQLYEISKSSGVCCGIIGSWGSGKSSFMKLMDEYVRKNLSSNVCVAWFVAWDPGGIEDLGDAMLYRLFHDIAGKNKDLSSAFKKLQKALGLRKSMRERARQALGVVSKVMPEPGRAVADVTGGLLEELDTPRKVQESFEKLVKWLEKNNRTVFFFIDDIDRATGEQIRDLLSELKVYISHRRIAVVLGYDEEYVLNALREPVLPSGIDPRKYLEKIVTVRRKLPIPKSDQLRSYAMHHLQSVLGLKEEVCIFLGNLVHSLSFDNPRRLKILVLNFENFLSSVEHKKLSRGALESILVTCAAADMGFLAEDGVRMAFISGNEARIISALKEFAAKYPDKTKEANTLIQVVEWLRPRFVQNMPISMRLTSDSLRLPSQGRPTQERPGLQTSVASTWKMALVSILSNASSRGFKLGSDTVEPGEIAVSSSTKVERFLLDEANLFKAILHRPPKSPIFLLRSDRSNIVLLFSSDVERDPRRRPLGEIHRLLLSIFRNCAKIVSKKGLIVWVIDDANAIDKTWGSPLVKEAQEMSKGLKHPFIFQWTPISKIKPLVEYLLSVVGASKTDS